MKLREQVETAILCCAVLAVSPSDSYVSTRRLARHFSLPKEYLGKTLAALSRAGLIEGTLGPEGGYRLAKRAGEISLLDIVTAINGIPKTFVGLGHLEKITGGTTTLAQSIIEIFNEADRAWAGVLSEQNLESLVTSISLKSEDIGIVV